jgi:predicted nuclease of predicted toxin-antitoxin system
MRFLIDENLAKSCAAVLRSLGHEAVHVAEIGLTSTDDEDIVAFALRENYIVVTFDLDFSRIVALSKKPFPSIITFRLGEISPREFQEIMLLHLPNLSADLPQGALVTIDSRGVRIQKLPVVPKR